ncbi:MAG: M48 family metalloprotease [Candidatus Binatia bacterium]
MTGLIATVAWACSLQPSTGVGGGGVGGQRQPKFAVVDRADFPDGTESMAVPRAIGSAMLQDALSEDPRVARFLDERGIPDAIALNRHAGAIYFAYLASEKLYALYREAGDRHARSGDGPLEIRERPLLRDELYLLDPGRRLELEVDYLSTLVSKAVPLQRVSRRLMLNLPPSSDEGDAGHGWGFFYLPVSPASAKLFGLDVDAPGVVVAWVDPEGPAAGALRNGDVITSLNGKGLAELGRFVLEDLASATFGVARSVGEASVYVEAERWPRDTKFFMVEYAIPSAGRGEESVVVASSMLDLLESDDQLAMVLGHELAHITSGHGRPARGPAGVLRGLLHLGSVGILDPVMDGIAARFNRSEEREADALGVRYAVAAGYDPRAFGEVMALLAERGGAKGLMRFFDRHPSYPERAEFVRKLMAGGIPAAPHVDGGM